MIGVEMDLHTAFHLIGASGIVVQAADEVFREHPIHDHPHALSMDNAFHIDAEDELHEVAHLKIFTDLEGWNLERLREITVQ